MHALCRRVQGRTIVLHQYASSVNVMQYVVEVPSVLRMVTSTTVTTGTIYSNPNVGAL
jgi:hypothetical protein